MKILTKPLPNDQCSAFSNPLSTNHIVRALYIRAQRHPWVVKNRVTIIGVVCGKACALAQMAVESSLYQAKVHEVSSISNDMQLLLRHKLLLGLRLAMLMAWAALGAFGLKLTLPALV